MAAEETFNVVVTKKPEMVMLKYHPVWKDLIAEWNLDPSTRTPTYTAELLTKFKDLDSRLADETTVNVFVSTVALHDQMIPKVGSAGSITIAGGGKRKNAAQQLQQFFKNQLLKRKNKNKNGGRSRKQNKRNQKNKSSKQQRGGQQSRRQQQQRNKNKRSRRQQNKN